MASRSDVAVIAVVGDGMAGTPGIAARVFVALAQSGLNVIAVAQGSSERNISFVVRADQAQEAARRVHDAFQLAKIGGGRSQEALAHGRGAARLRPGGPRAGERDAGRRRAATSACVGLLDRSGYVFDPRGLSARRLRRLAEGKDKGELLAKLGGVASSAEDALAFVASHAVSRPVLVDVTAEETGDLLSGGARPRVRPRAREQEAAGGTVPEPRGAAGGGRGLASGASSTRRRSARACPSSTRTGSSSRAATA